MQKFPFGKFAIMSGGLLALGYGLMKYTVPTAEESYAAMAPDLRKKVDAARAYREAQEKAHAGQPGTTAQSSGAEPEKPIWNPPVITKV